MNDLTTTKHSVLIIGSAGKIGRATVRELLACGMQVRGFDRVPTPGLDESFVGDIGDAETLRRAMAGVDTLIHLAATPDDDDFLSQLLPNNIVGLFYVMEAARLSGVRRLILASSGQVNWWQKERGPWPIRVEDPTTPRYWYAATKMFLEAIGQGFAESHGMSVLAVRLGWCPRTREQEQEIADSPSAQDLYLSPHDAGRFFACAVLAPNIRYSVVYANSKPLRQPLFDAEPARRLLGFEPQEAWPQGSEYFR